MATLIKEHTYFYLNLFFGRGLYPEDWLRVLFFHVYCTLLYWEQPTLAVPCQDIWLLVRTSLSWWVRLTQSHCWCLIVFLKFHLWPVQACRTSAYPKETLAFTTSRQRPVARFTTASFCEPNCITNATRGMLIKIVTVVTMCILCSMVK